MALSLERAAVELRVRIVTLAVEPLGFPPAQGHFLFLLFIMNVYVMAC